jgi:hypothetical protein
MSSFPLPHSIVFPNAAGTSLVGYLRYLGRWVPAWWVTVWVGSVIASPYSLDRYVTPFASIQSVHRLNINGLDILRIHPIRLIERGSLGPKPCKPPPVFTGRTRGPPRMHGRPGPGRGPAGRTAGRASFVNLGEGTDCKPIKWGILDL